MITIKTIYFMLALLAASGMIANTPKPPKTLL